MEQEDSLRKEFSMTNLELLWGTEMEISFALSHFIQHIKILKEILNIVEMGAK